MSARKEKGKKKRHWRENIEALTMAIAVALLFKLFVLEISKIPSGSMQPTLMGDPGSSTFDRILVDKLSYSLRDPRRFEIVVFQHPLERSRVMVKRLVGMPSEGFRIANGDLWRRASADEPWEIIPRPVDLLEESWKSLEARDETGTRWTAVEDAADWRFHGRDIKASGPGKARFERRPGGVIYDEYTDGYADALRDEIEHFQDLRHVVGDLRLDGEIVARAGTEAVLVELAEGMRTYVFRLPGPAAPADARPELVVSDGPTVRATHTAETGFRLGSGDTHSFSARNLDDRLTLLVDGDVVLTAVIDPVSAGDQIGNISVAIEGTGAELKDLMPFRDVFYFYYDKESRREPDEWVLEIPADHYVMLGDNTLDSADGRDWRAKTYFWTDEDGREHRARGNYRPGMQSGANPVEATFETEKDGYAFRDEWGTVHWFRKDRESRERVEFRAEPAPFVPRQLVHGRALAVFWPLKPLSGVWRLGWLH